MGSGQNMRYLSKAGFSNIIGLLVAVAIIFTILLPLNLYNQDLQNKLIHTVRERKALDDMRFNERLRLNAFEVLDDTKPNKNHIIIIAENIGKYPIIIVRIIIARESFNGNATIIPIDGLNSDPPLPYILLPQNITYIDTNVVAEEGVKYYIRVVTSRGNIFLPNENILIGGKGAGQSSAFPYLFGVTITNMRNGKDYNFTLIGNVPYSPFTVNWQATASNIHQSFIFGVSPGDYILILKEDGDEIYRRVVRIPEIIAVIIDVENLDGG